MQQDSTDTSGSLDGSVAALNGFLRELVELAGQDTGTVPVLELQFGEIVTKASVETSGNEYLLVTALLPRFEQSQYSPLPPATPNGKIEFLWHADEGRYIAVRKVPVASLPDERSVMDAIMTTSDEAEAWFSSMCIAAKRKP